MSDTRDAMMAAMADPAVTDEALGMAALKLVFEALDDIKRIANAVEDIAKKVGAPITMSHGE